VTGVTGEVLWVVTGVTPASPVPGAAVRAQVRVDAHLDAVMDDLVERFRVG